MTHAASLSHGHQSHHGEHLAHAGTGCLSPEPVKSGRHQSTSEVVREALRLLEDRDRDREAAFLEVKAKLKRGAAQARRGDLLAGDKVFDELRQMIAERRRSNARKPRPSSPG